MRKHAWAYLAAVVLVWLFFAQAVGNLSAQSPVVDEPSHLARAMAYWRVGDLRLQLGHPPLVHALAGLPLLLEPSVPDVSSLPGWQAPFDRETLNGHALWDPERATDRIVFLARWTVLMLAALLGALIFRWAGERFGLRGAVAALFLFAFDPNLLAHSVVVTTDVAVTFFILLAVYSFDRWARHPSRRWLAISGIALGLAMGTKFSAIILLPVLGLLALYAGWRERRILPRLLGLAAIFVIGAVVVWAVYRFEVGPFDSPPITVPAPTLWNGLLRVKERDEEGRIAFLLGQISPKGWWYYFPVALAVKTPLPTLLLLGAVAIHGLVSIYHWMRSGHPEELGRHIGLALALVLLPLAYFAVSLRSTLNIGYRHILPVLPFFFIVIAGLRITRQAPARTRGQAPARAQERVAQIAGLLLAAWLVAGAASVYPDHLAYFNEAAGGPDNGYQILADSNLDWGQNIKRLKLWLEARHIGPVRLAAFTGSVPERYGLQVIKLPGPYEPPDAYGFQRFAPAPGVYAIGASSWQGLRLDNPDTFDWFRRQKPVARIGHSLFVYQVPESPATEKWAAVCYAPDGPVDGDGLAAGLGRTDLRSIFFDCRSSWVYVHDGGPGYYVVPAHGDPTIASEMLLGRATPVYHDRGNPVMFKDEPGLTLYRWEGEADAAARLAGLARPPGGAFDFGVASLIGYELSRGPIKPGGVISITTWWRANSPGEVLLSSYSHLMNGEILEASGDGLGMPPQMWQSGDVIVQRHVLKLRGDLPPGDYTLHIGLYLTPDGPRLPLKINGQLGDEHPMLTALRVTGK